MGSKWYMGTISSSEFGLLKNERVRV
jgi:hypothetical protein